MQIISPYKRPGPPVLAIQQLPPEGNDRFVDSPITHPLLKFHIGGPGFTPPLVGRPAYAEGNDRFLDSPLPGSQRMALIGSPRRVGPPLLMRQHQFRAEGNDRFVDTPLTHPLLKFKIGSRPVGPPLILQQAGNVATIQTIAGDIALTFAGPGIAITAEETFTATIAESFAGPAESFTAVETFSAVISETFAAPVIAFAALETFSGTVGVTFAAPALADNAIETFIATWDETMSAPVLSFTGSVLTGFVASVAIVFGGFSVSITGIVVNPPPPPVEKSSYTRHLDYRRGWQPYGPNFPNTRNSGF